MALQKISLDMLNDEVTALIVPAATTEFESYTLTQEDNNRTIQLSGSDPKNLTVPAGLVEPFSVRIIQNGTGAVTVVPSGTTVHSLGGLLGLAGQHAVALIVRESTANTFNLSGDLA